MKHLVHRRMSQVSNFTKPGYAIHIGFHIGTNSKLLHSWKQKCFGLGVTKSGLRRLQAILHRKRCCCRERAFFLHRSKMYARFSSSGCVENYGDTILIFYANSNLNDALITRLLGILFLFSIISLQTVLLYKFRYVTRLFSYCFFFLRKTKDRILFPLGNLILTN